MSVQHLNSNGCIIMHHYTCKHDHWSATTAEVRQSHCYLAKSLVNTAALNSYYSTQSQTQHLPHYTTCCVRYYNYTNMHITSACTVMKIKMHNLWRNNLTNLAVGDTCSNASFKSSPPVSWLSSTVRAHSLSMTNILPRHTVTVLFPWSQHV